jgi:hypothetical protein
MSTPTTEGPIASAGDAERVIESLNAITDQLEETIEEETARVRAGRLRDAAELGETKAEISRRYTAETMRVIAARELIARSLPDAYAALRERHGAFQALLQTNMTVLATAHAVAEGIIRGVSGELARRRAPSTYGPSGRANLPSPRANQPLAISRTL